MENVLDLQDVIKQRGVCSLGELKIQTKTVNIISGLSMSGKTATCLHFANDAIKNDMRVLYYDTEDKAATRPEPNLFKEFLKKNPEKYNKNFMCVLALEPEKIFERTEQFKPDLIIIDSLSAPFIKLIKHPYQRANRLSEFLSRLRAVLVEKDIACVATLQARKKKTASGDFILEITGGEGLQYLSDSKIIIKDMRDGERVDDVGGARKYIVDKQFAYAFVFDAGGHITPVGKKITKDLNNVAK